MTISIKDRWTGKVIWSGEAATVREAVDICYRSGIPLSGAYLKGANLTGAYLKGADLHGANLTGADLKGADLHGANLTGAYLKGADLKGADLTGADLTGADLKDADLKGANLTGAYLHGANLTGAYLKGADLKDADLTGAYLKGAYLKGADLKGADLKDADLTGAAAIDTGEPWKEYLSQVVPALLTAGGKSLLEVATKEHWDCHEWSNCPSAAAFSCNDLSGVPLLLRPRVEQFIKFFDARLIPLEAVLKEKATDA